MTRIQHAPATARTLPAALYGRGRRYLQRLGRLLASRNSRMPEEGSCRLCGICHHVCGLLGDRRPRNGSED